MKKILKSSVLAAAIIGCSTTGAWATPDLFDWAFNIDGGVTKAPAGYNLAGMPVTTALGINDLGVLTWSTDAVGVHSFLAFFDYEIDEATNSYFNESGSFLNAPAVGQSWEIDEPGYLGGDIFTNLLAGDLDSTNALPAGQEDDVSMAMGWTFNLNSGEMATITLTLSGLEPTSGFYLTQHDDDPNSESIYFSGNLRITGGGPDPVPEPATMLLMGGGLVGLLGASRRKRKNSINDI